MTGTARVAGWAMAAGVAMGCGAREPEAATAFEPAQVEIVAPVDGDSVSLPITIRLTASGITIAPASGVREAGIGHHHLLVDADHSPDDQPIPTGNGYIHLGSGVSEWVLDSLPPGPHRIIARLAWGDHVPVTGGVTDTIRIVVRGQ